MSLEMTFIYLVCGTCAMFMFGLFIFVFGMTIVIIIDARNLKNKKVVPIPADDVILEKKREAQKLAITERGLKAFSGE